jgi:hypothetical protein
MPDPENPQDPTTPKSASRGEIVAAIGLFLAGFALVAFLLHLTIRNPLYLHADVRSEKLVILERLHGSVYSAAFGTSRVHNGFDPRAFDAVLNTHSMNLGIEGGSQAEQRVMALEFVRQLTPPPDGEPCIVLLEIKAGANFQNMHLVHPRAINVYDWNTTRFISHLTNSSMSLSQRMGRTGYALTAMLLHYINLGMISNEIFSPPLDSAMIADEMKQNQRGLLTNSLSPQDQPSIKHQLSEKPSQPGSEQGILTPGNADLISELTSASPVRNLAFAYFALPITGDVSHTEGFPDHLTADGQDVPIVNLARPKVYPALYRPEMFHDVGHLTEAGASQASKLMAEQLKAWYDAHGGLPHCESRESGH